MGFVSLSNTVPYLTTPGGDLSVNAIQVFSVSTLEQVTVNKLDGIEEEKVDG